MTLKGRIGPDGLPNFDMGGLETGITPAQDAAMAANLTALDDAIATLRKSVSEAEAERKALLSWIELIERATAIVIPIIERVAAGSASTGATEPKIDWRSLLLNGAADVIKAPADQRQQTVAGLIESVLRGVGR